LKLCFNAKFSSKTNQMKIKKIEPQQLVDKNIGYKEYRKILKPALKRMLGEHNTVETKTDFIVKTNFEYSDLKGKKMGLIILGDHTSGWIKTVRDQVKEDKKNTTKRKIINRVCRIPMDAFNLHD